MKMPNLASSYQAGRGRESSDFQLDSHEEVGVRVERSSRRDKRGDSGGHKEGRVMVEGWSEDEIEDTVSFFRVS